MALLEDDFGPATWLLDFRESGGRSTDFGIVDEVSVNGEGLRSKVKDGVSDGSRRS
jgi:hypothetical protein